MGGSGCRRSVSGMPLQVWLSKTHYLQWGEINDSHDLFRATWGTSFLFPFIEEAEHRSEVAHHSSV